MGLTPLDIQNKEFGRSFRGYNEAEVDEFLDRIVREFDALTKDNAALREQVESLSAKVEQFRRLEDTLHNTLVVAQQAADEVKASARKEADVILEQARLQAEQILRDAEARAEAARRGAEELIRRARVYQAQVKGMLASQLDLLESEGRKLEQATAEVAAALAQQDRISPPAPPAPAAQAAAPGAPEPAADGAPVSQTGSPDAAQGAGDNGTTGV
ncbi:MAG TPA: DivIVA domain-containing protein [Bacillota bacterium]